jgi:hypothetical protein
MPYHDSLPHTEALSPTNNNQEECAAMRSRLLCVLCNAKTCKVLLVTRQQQLACTLTHATNNSFAFVHSHKVVAGGRGEGAAVTTRASRSHPRRDTALALDFVPADVAAVSFHPGGGGQGASSRRQSMPALGEWVAHCHFVCMRVYCRTSPFCTTHCRARALLATSQ